jgi:uncharacterized protein with HEPN domain
MSPDRDLVRLSHMLEAARDARDMAARANLEELRINRMLQLALVKSIEIIGEAARQVSVSARARFPDISWGEIIGMRHRLIHTYYEIDARLVWNTVTEDLPVLIAPLEPLVPPGLPRLRDSFDSSPE